MMVVENIPINVNNVLIENVQDCVYLGVGTTLQPQ